jgi:hypothetical protein
MRRRGPSLMEFPDVYSQQEAGRLVLVLLETTVEAFGGNRRKTGELLPQGATRGSSRLRQDRRAVFCYGSRGSITEPQIIEVPAIESRKRAVVANRASASARGVRRRMADEQCCAFMCRWQARRWNSRGRRHLTGEEACCAITSRWGTSRSTPGGIHRSRAAACLDKPAESADPHSTMRSTDHPDRTCVRTDSDA